MSDQLTFSAEVKADVARDFSRAVRVGVFCAFALLIILGPFAAQILGVRHGLLRPWTMFSAGGVGILDGQFRAVDRDGNVKLLSPLQVLGADRYPPMLTTQFPLRVTKPEELRKFAEAYCVKNPAVTLSFTGRVGTRHGWRQLHHDNICERPADARN